MIQIKKITRLLLLIISVCIHLNVKAQNFNGKSLRIGIYSSTPLEDIKAVSDKAAAVLISKTQEIAIQVPIKSLEFDRKLMQEHFNENYLESDKYPYAKFKGNITPALDFNKDGDYNVTVNGTLSVHGVDKKRTIPGRLTIKDGVVQISTEFKVACVDHNIDIPKLVFTKIAEFISVKVDGKLSPLK